MVISDVQIADVKQYANVYHNLDDNLFTSILAAAKAFIVNYTSIPEARNPTLPIVNPILPYAQTVSGTMASDGYTVNVTLADGTVISTTPTSGTAWTVNVPSGKSINDGDVISVTQQASSTSPLSSPTNVIASYDPSTAPFPRCLDDFENLTIALLILCNEMYDNRMVTLDANKVNINFVVKTLLDSHSMNLL